jgi:hypothetical protein
MAADDLRPYSPGLVRLKPGLCKGLVRRRSPANPFRSRTLGPKVRQNVEAMGRGGGPEAREPIWSRASHPGTYAVPGQR